MDFNIPIPEMFWFDLGVSVVAGTLVFGLIQKIKELSFINKPIQLWFGNLIFSLIAYPFSKFYYSTGDIESIWIVLFTFIGAQLIYEMLKKQNIINYTPKTLDNTKEEIEEKPTIEKIIPRQMLVSESKYKTKCPYEMDAEYITIHNTANKASANNEIKYMIDNNKQVSFHFAVDDIEVVQGLLLNRNGWHAGDGSKGIGNRKSIGIEICHSTGDVDKFKKSEEKSAVFVAQLLKERSWGIEKVKKHQDWSKKNCPHKTLELGWQRYLDMIKKYL